MTCLETSKKLCTNNDCKVCFKRSFASHPKAFCWSSKNELLPRMIVQSSNQKNYFNCDQCNHLFSSQLVAISRGQWCSYCANKKLCTDINCQVCFEKSFASHPMASSWSPKNKKTPRELFRSSREKVWIDCLECFHSNEVTLTNATNGQGCPYCSNRKLCSDINCQICFNKSFESLLETNSLNTFSWSIKNEMLPRNIFRSSTYRGIFECHKCCHTFEAALHNITAGYGCPYCTNQSLCSDINCQLCFEKSFASHPMASSWSPKNKLNPRDVFKATHKKYIFDCQECSHTFEYALHNVKAGYGCPYCSNSQLCVNDCQDCFKKSFASHPKAFCWSSKNEKTPRDIFKHTHYKYWFECDECKHSFEAYLKNIAYGQWCPHCKKKTELKLYNWLISQYSNIQREVKFDWCRNKTTNKHYRFDFLWLDQRILIELDGRQHFEDIFKKWKCSYEEIQERDVYKMKKAIENGYSIIRILQEDVLMDAYDWKQTLKDTIELCNIHQPTVHYICKNEEYEVYKGRV